MAAADATVFAVKGQALRIYGTILDATTGNGIATIGTLTATLSRDGATFAAATNSPVQVTGANGEFYLDLDADDDMDYYHVKAIISSDTSDAVDCRIDISNCVLSETTGHARAQSVLRLEQFVTQTHAYLWNKIGRAISTGLITLYTYAGATFATFGMTRTSDNIDKEVGT